MPGPAGILFILLFCTAGFALAQSNPERSPLELGKAAMDAHDPTAAIAHFERADGQDARAWLAVALMMESRSPSDAYVERAFDAAASARTDRPGQRRSRAELVASLRPGEMVMTTLVAERHAYAWAFDRDSLIGFPLPPPAEIATAVERVDAYIAKSDRAGVQRIAEELMPNLLGPVVGRLPALTRVIFMMDGPLRQLPIAEMPISEGEPILSQRLDVATVFDYGALLDEIAQRPAAPAAGQRPSSSTLLAAGVIVLVIGAGVAALRRRSSVA
jgi:hypothetical protein